ncbi:MAG: phytochelatin synthase [Deltaproteobacteria bacterium]|nr:phytochelatin synthase [Deltaproteobacteria bacterium]
MTLARSLPSCLLALGLAACASSPPAAPGPAASTPSDVLVPFASEESAARLERSRHKADFFALANHFEGQIHGGMCGPTTAVIVLNALRVARAEGLPIDRSAIPERFHAQIPPRFDPFFARYTQRGFFDDPRVAGVKTEEVFYGAPPAPGDKPDPGMQLRQLHAIFVAYGLESTLRIVDDRMDEAAIRRELMDDLARPDGYVVVNYTRKVLDQDGGGHISPVGAYDEASDSFLVLDVNPNRGKTWAWVPTRRLVAAMRTFDTNENRGYLLVREGRR